MNGSNRNFHSTNTYVHDAWKARYCPQKPPPRKEIRYLGGSNHQSAFLDSHSRSPSPNLPRIPYLHRGNQRYYPSPPRCTTTTSRRPKAAKQPSISHDADVSRRSIPEHVLMKSLLNGLEDFTWKASQVRPKSTGNITTTPPNHFLPDGPLRKPPRSQVDFSKSPPIEFKRTLQKRVIDDDEAYKSETSCIECIKEKRNHVAQNCTCCPECLKLQGRRTRPNNLVAQRKQFFESQIKPPPKSEEVTEIYRNFKSVFSTSTLSKRSSSVPPCVLKTLPPPRNSDLFNPDYNFNYCSRKSLIDSIRSKIFHSSSDCEGWGACKLPKFPRETRRAMSIILSNGNSKLSCRICQGKLNAADVETQTTPVASQQGFGSKIPCTKNLLCNRGLHAGQCEENVRRKLRVVCAEDCVCRNGRRMIPYEQLSFPSRNSKKEEKASEESLLGFLKCDIEVEGRSGTDSHCESCIRDEQSMFTPQKLNHQTSRCYPESEASEESLLGILRSDLEVEGRSRTSDEGRSRTSSECEGSVRGKLEDVKMSFV